MEEILKKLNINNVFTKTPPKQKKFNSVKNGVPPIANYNFEADLLHLPKTSKGLQYLFVITDLANNKFDIEPMKNKSSTDCVEAFKKILKRTYIGKPQISLRTDNGTEFKKEFDTFLKKVDVLHLTTLPYRHQQMANAESLNRQLGTILNNYMNQKELDTEKPYNEWTDILPFIRKELNKHRATTLPAYKDWNLKIFDPTKVQGDPKFKMGNLVHRKLDYPKNALGHNQATANFRVGDFRWETNARKIVKVVYMPDAPYYRYVLEGLPNVSYSEIELLSSSEAEPKYIIERFLETKVVNKKRFYKIKWKELPVKNATWEPENELIRDIGEQSLKNFVAEMKKKK